MKKNALFLSLLFLTGFIFGQSNLTLTFSAIENTSYVQLDSVRVINLTQNCDTVLHWPDTSLNLSYVGIAEFRSQDDLLQVFQNYPNPAKDKTTISVYLPKNDDVIVSIINSHGKTELVGNFSLEGGIHNFIFSPGKAHFYIFSVLSSFGTSSIKILCSNLISRQNPVLNHNGLKNSQLEKRPTNIRQRFTFNPDDELLINGIYGSLNSWILDNPESNQKYIFQFAFNIACPEQPTVEYGNQIYYTVQIFNQCWLKENLNIGQIIPLLEYMEDNEIIEKHCSYNDLDSCSKYGGLYQWDEMMQYSSQQINQGICPDGWHIPTDMEWTILEGSVDSQFGAEDIEWETEGFRGFDVGCNLKSTNGFSNNGNGNNMFGFDALPGGNHYQQPGIDGFWWTSQSSFSYAWYRTMNSYQDGSGRSSEFKEMSHSVRCIMDNYVSDPVADFSFSPVHGIAPLTVSFIDESTKNPENWLWDFGDGNSSIERNPYHVYQDTGVYFVSLTVFNQFGADTYVSLYPIIVIDEGGGEPCPGIEAVNYGGKIYNTILIGEQCWLKENLDIGEMIPCEQDMEDNGIIEKYCYDDNPENCDIYGGLYQFEEMMQYSTQSDLKGICPDGWHLPNDEEWKILEGTVDSQFPSGDPEWNKTGWRGMDAGLNLKSPIGWVGGGSGTNLYGFQSLPGGHSLPDGTYTNLGGVGYWWSYNDTLGSNGMYRRQNFEEDRIYRNSLNNQHGLSIRCIKNQ